MFSLRVWYPGFGSATWDWSLVHSSCKGHRSHINKVPLCHKLVRFFYNCLYSCVESMESFNNISSEERQGPIFSLFRAIVFFVSGNKGPTGKEMAKTKEVIRFRIRKLAHIENFPQNCTRKRRTTWPMIKQVI